MDVVISPYHLTTREPPVMAALLLADRALTLMPAPAERASVGDVRRAVERAPRYYEFMESWSWSMPLWRKGIIATAPGIDAAAPMRESLERVRASEHFAPLQEFMREGLFASEDHFLELVARDVLRGGPDPGISIPVCAGLDAFASDEAMIVVRAAPTSLAQRAESRLARRAFSIVVPIMLQAPARRVLDARELLAQPLDRLRRELAEAFPRATARPGATPRGHADAGGLSAAACELAEAFDDHRDLICEPVDEDVKVIAGLVSITGVILPADAVLRSSLAAARSLSGARGRSPNGAAPPSTRLPAVRDRLAEQSVMTLIVRALDR